MKGVTTAALEAPTAITEAIGTFSFQRPVTEGATVEDGFVTGEVKEADFEEGQ